jgi:hypothetical protein
MQRQFPVLVGELRLVRTNLALIPEYDHVPIKQISIATKQNFTTMVKNTAHCAGISTSLESRDIYILPRTSMQQGGRVIVVLTFVKSATLLDSISKCASRYMLGTSRVLAFSSQDTSLAR